MFISLHIRCYLLINSAYVPYRTDLKKRKKEKITAGYMSVIIEKAKRI